jgi:hypothetical protein
MIKGFVYQIADVDQEAYAVDGQDSGRSSEHVVQGSRDLR